MKIVTLKLGLLQTNCYVIINGNKALIVDPADKCEEILNVVKDKTIEGILLTHKHFDHVGALNSLKSQFQLQENDFSSIKSFDFEVIATPGHSSDSLTFYFAKEKAMFTGDFLFYQTIGRTDLPTSSPTAMQESLNLIKRYPDDIKIYPGHGPSSILGEEKKLFNYYF